MTSKYFRVRLKGNTPEISGGVYGSGNSYPAPQRIWYLASSSTSGVAYWDPVIGATGYDFRIRPVGSNMWITSGNLSDTDIAVSALTLGVTYEIQARAIHGSSVSDWTPSFTFTTSVPTIQFDYSLPVLFS